MTDDLADCIHWKRTVAGIAIAFMAPAVLVTIGWDEMWTLRHLFAGAVGLLFLVAGVGVSRGWGFRD